MLNKFFKIIHNKYSKLFGFIFFLRYLITIFFISIVLFLVIPNFFNFDKRIETIKGHLSNSYKLDIYEYEQIKFNTFPQPNIEIKNVLINLDTDTEKLNVGRLKLFPKIFSIYNFDNFKLNKIVVEDSKILLKASSFKTFIKKIFNKKNKQSFNNLNVKIIEKNKPVISIENIDFSNHGYKMNLVTGSVFGKKFNAEIKNNFKKINFKLLKSGFTAEVDLSSKQNLDLISGVFKSKILNTNLKLNFDYDTKQLNIYNSYFRSKNLSFANEGSIIFYPFLDITVKLLIEDINTYLIKDIDLKNLFKSKNFLKKLNMKNEINYKSKKFKNHLIDELDLRIELAYGRMNYIKKLSIFNNSLNCFGNINFLEDYPLLFFDCSMMLSDKKQFFKKFSIKETKKKSNSKFYFTGNLNILNNKINFKSITNNENYKASKEDLKYFKSNFENLLFDGSFFEIFSLKKIKKFILEIS